MKKYLVFEFSDGNDYQGIIFEDISGVMEWIKADAENLSEFDAEDYEYTIKPVFMTRRQLNALPEHD